MKAQKAQAQQRQAAQEEEQASRKPIEEDPPISKPSSNCLPPAHSAQQATGALRLCPTATAAGGSSRLTTAQGEQLIRLWERLRLHHEQYHEVFGWTLWNKPRQTSSAAGRHMERYAIDSTKATSMGSTNKSVIRSLKVLKSRIQMYTCSYTVQDVQCGGCAGAVGFGVNGLCTKCCEGVRAVQGAVAGQAPCADTMGIELVGTELNGAQKKKSKCGQPKKDAADSQGRMVSPIGKPKHTHTHKTSNQKSTLVSIGLTKESDQPKFGDGTVFEKQFGGVVYHGKVAAYDTNSRWYHVTYNDNDEEEMSENELELLMQKKPTAVVKPSSSSKRDTPVSWIKAGVSTSEYKQPSKGPSKRKRKQVEKPQIRSDAVLQDVQCGGCAGAVGFGVKGLCTKCYEGVRAVQGAVAGQAPCADTMGIELVAVAEVSKHTEADRPADSPPNVLPHSSREDESKHTVGNTTGSRAEFKKDAEHVDTQGCPFMLSPQSTPTKPSSMAISQTTQQSKCLQQNQCTERARIGGAKLRKKKKPKRVHIKQVAAQ